MSANSRTGLIAQQLMPTLTNIIHERNASVGNQVTNKPILVINSNSETYTSLNAINIIGTLNISGVFYYLMTVIPAICLASEAGVEIDDASLQNWWHSYAAQKSNKNIEYFMEWLQKIKTQGGKTMQKIYFGSPGTGKSHDIEEHLLGIVTNEDEQVYRTTFHPEYSYSDFVGQIMPARIYNTLTGQYDISYEFYEGVFTRALKEAYQDLNKDIYLVIEEMSRGNVAAIFGDLFQLLDRHFIGTRKGWSKYGIRNDRVATQVRQLTNDVILLPPNLHIFGTVNTSDQNVFTMDTAFKRRFQWEYVHTTPVINASNTTPITLTDKYLNNPTITFELDNGPEDVFWTDLYGTLNIFIADNRYLGMGEDKQIGPFFIDFTGMNSVEIKDEILNKLLNYLWTDIANSRNSRNTPLFNQNVITSFSTLYEKFDNNGRVFSDEFISAYRQWQNNSL